MKFEEAKKTLFDRAIPDYKVPMDHETMMTYLEFLSDRYPFLSVGTLGESIFGRRIPVLSIGEGSRGVLYVGAHHGMEWITTVLLLRFINEFCELKRLHGRIYRYTLDFICATKTLYFIPMLNPDGVEYQIHGVEEKNPIYDRLIAMNGGSQDFSRWQANGRGVDLNHNYNAGFGAYKAIETEAGIFGGAPTKYSGTMPESEPEVGQLCNFLRFHEDIGMVLTLHTQGEEIYYTSGGRMAPRSRSIAAAFSRMTGYSLGIPEGSAAYGGMTDWVIEELGRPSFTIECGKGENPLPLSDYFKIYTRLREMLFMAPTFL